MYTVRAHDRNFLHLWAWLEKRNWKPLWLSFGTQKPLPWVGKQYFTFVLCFWLNQHCLVVRSKEGKRRHNIPSSSKKSFTDCPVDPRTWLLFPFVCEKSEAHMSEKPCVKVFQLEQSGANIRGSAHRRLKLMML